MKIKILKKQGKTLWISPHFCLLIFLFIALPATAKEGSNKKYVGSAACQTCHQTQYASFQSHARHSRSFESVQKMKKELTPEEMKECYACHTMGYGKPGGFISLEETPELKNVGCEVCHGPGRLHIETGNPADINRKVTIDLCNECHIEERVNAFRYKPIIFAGSH
jgi:hypothetical protein